MHTNPDEVRARLRGRKGIGPIDPPSPPIHVPLESQSTPQITKLHPTIEIVEGNLLNQRTNAWVNPWNSNYFHGWKRCLHIKLGVSGQMVELTGKAPFDELSKRGSLPLGQAYLTGAGDRSFHLRGIIHAACIQYPWGSNEDLIRKSVRSICAIAANEKFESVATPLIGAGHGGVPPQSSLNWIQDEASKADYQGRVVIVCYRPDPFHRIKRTILI